LNGRFTSSERNIIIALLLVCTIAAYWQVRNFDFVGCDDPVYIFGNRYVADGLTWPNVVWAFTKTHSYNWHPLTWMSHQLDSSIHGIKEAGEQKGPGGHHMTSVIIHAVNAALLFLVLTRLTGYPWRSAVVAGLFALHPLHVESVAWISERKDVLSTFFWLLTMWAYAVYCDSPNIKRYLLVVAAFVLGLMSKPMLVTLPVVLLILDYWPLRRMAGTVDADPKRARRFIELLMEKTPLLVLSAASCVVTYLAQLYGGATRGFDLFPFGTRVANAVWAYVEYIIKMFVPLNLAYQYPHPGTTLPEWQVVATSVTLAVLTVSCLWFGRRRPYLAVGWLWYLVTLVPVIGLVQVGLQSMADRYTYVPLTGLFIIVVWAVADLVMPRKAREPVEKQFSKSSRARGRKSSDTIPAQGIALGVVACLVIGALGVATYFQSRFWKDNFTLFPRSIACTTGGYVAEVSLGSAYGNLGTPEDYRTALKHYHRALEIRPDYGPAHLCAGIAYLSLGRLDEGIEYLERSVEMNRQKGPIYEMLVVAYARKGDAKNAWKSVRRCESAGWTVSQDILSALSAEMPEPSE